MEINSRMKTCRPTQLKLVLLLLKRINCAARNGMEKHTIEKVLDRLYCVDGRISPRT